MKIICIRGVCGFVCVCVCVFVLVDIWSEKEKWAINKLSFTTHMQSMCGCGCGCVCACVFGKLLMRFKRFVVGFPWRSFSIFSFIFCLFIFGLAGFYARTEVLHTFGHMLPSMCVWGRGDVDSWRRSVWWGGVSSSCLALATLGCWFNYNPYIYNYIDMKSKRICQK